MSSRAYSITVQIQGAVQAQSALQSLAEAVARTNTSISSGLTAINNFSSTISNLDSRVSSANSPLQQLTSTEEQAAIVDDYDFSTHQDIQDATLAAIQRAFDLISKKLTFSNNNVIQLDSQKIAQEITKTKVSQIGKW